MLFLFKFFLCKGEEQIQGNWQIPKESIKIVFFFKEKYMKRVIVAEQSQGCKEESWMYPYLCKHNSHQKRRREASISIQVWMTIASEILSSIVPGPMFQHGMSELYNKTESYNQANFKIYSWVPQRWWYCKKDEAQLIAHSFLSLNVVGRNLVVC